MAFTDNWNYAAPGTTGGPQQTIPGGGGDLTFGLVPRGSDINIGLGKDGPPSLWDKLTDALGAFPKTSMPGTTVGAPAGQTPPAAPAMPNFPAGPRPPGMGAYFQALQNPPARGGNLMAHYAALQQLMRGS